MHAAEFDFDAANAALNLVGHELPGGWYVEELLPGSDGSSGGAFSVSYRVRNSTGREGFLKVADLVSVFGDDELLSAALATFMHERDLLLMCEQGRLSHVVMAIDYGHVKLEGFLLPHVRYIVFEHANGGDVRTFLSDSERITELLRFELLHHVTVGVAQLHRSNIAHQDIKPSNALTFRAAGGKTTTKVSDLGRAFHVTRSAVDDESAIPGDRNYAAPEQLYGLPVDGSMTRRFASDLYQLGNFATFIFGGMTMNSLLSSALSSELHWSRFGDGYWEALPYLEEAFARAMAEVRLSIAMPEADEIAELIEYLCEPDFRRRGHPSASHGVGNRYSLERVISSVNLIAFRASVRRGAMR